MMPTFSGGNDTRTIRADQDRRFALHEARHPGHVQYRYALGDAHNHFYPCGDGFRDRIRRKSRRNENARDVGPFVANRLQNRIENRDVFRNLTALAGRDTGHDLGAVVNHLPSVEGPLSTGDALHHHPAFLINQYAHV
jgi:hypothetical protein